MRRGFGRRQVPLPGRPPGMAATGPDLYESLQIRYPPSPTRASAPASPPAASRWPLGTILAVGVGVVLVLGAALATLITLHVQGQAELQAARAELAAVRTPLLPDPDGPRSPHESPAAAQRRRDQLGAVPGLAVPPGEDLLLLGGAEALERGGGCLPLHALPPHLHHQPRGAGLPGAGGERRILLDRAGGHGQLLALGGRGCLLPGPEFLGAGAAGQHGPREVGPGGLRPDPPGGPRPLERP
ncbi:protein tfg-1-like isoform X4 [Grus americana]|uniref:protein tfg-1-like isoform X4 n=1 Tax=Grus americana TaxID=9117 RepID=UPI002407F026|nr:protein tfg-1-like isoform X4 [Grus americana]